MTLGGLLKHLALVEDDIHRPSCSGGPPGRPGTRSDCDGDPDWEWRSAADDSPEELYALWRGAVERSRAAMAEALADGGLDQPSKLHQATTGGRPTCGASWSTCTTSTPATSATPTSSARPSTAWSERTRRSDDGRCERPIRAEQLTIVPANEASWDDLVAIFGTADYPGRCQCQRFKVRGWMWRDSTQEERTAMLRAQTACGEPDAAATSGLVAYVDGEPAGWVAVEPRTAYPKLRTCGSRGAGGNEDKDDDGVWAVTCFAVRKGYRGRGLTYPLARATIDFARERGARALEAYPMITEPGKEITWGEVHVGARQVFEDAGFEEVSHPTLRRVVMRIDFDEGADAR